MKCWKKCEVLTKVVWKKLLKVLTKNCRKKGLLYDKKRKTRAGYLSKTYKDVIICLSVLPRLQFSIHLITQTLLGPVAVTVAWLYIKPFGEGPTGDPVDSDPDNKHPNWWKGVTNSDCLLSEPTVWSHKDFAILYETLTVFTHLACSRMPHLQVCCTMAVPLGVDCHPRTT